MNQKGSVLDLLLSPIGFFIALFALFFFILIAIVHPFDPFSGVGIFNLHILGEALFAFIGAVIVTLIIMFAKG